MPQELDQPKDRLTVFLESILGNKRTLGTILSRSERREAILDKASLEIAAFDPTETTTFVRTILKGLSREDDRWDQDRRDGALELLSLVDFGKLRGDELAQAYIDAVSSQTEDADPYGTISGLLEAGRVIGSYLPLGADIRERVNATWNNVASKFEGEDHRFIVDGKREVIEAIPLQAEDLIGNPEIRLGWRQQPKFEPGEQVLHDVYLESVRGQKTFKIALWENTPNFRALTQSHGVALERFWNLANPDEVFAGLETLRTHETSPALPYFDKALQAGISLTLDEITPEQTRYLADEVVQAGRVAQQDLFTHIGSFPLIVDRFRTLVGELKDKGPKAQRVLRGHIAHFFQENGIEVTGTSLEELEVLLEDNNVLSKVSQGFDRRQDSKREAAQLLEEVFRLGDKPANYSLMSRRREDLFLGDLTGDCTAYHLHTGLNAWTVPSWVANPGFNFFKITDNDHLVAKLGILLAIAGEQPTLVVDSFEVGQGIRNEQSAIEKIRGGLRFLGQWAQGIGLPDVYVNTISNSSGAVDLLKGVVKASSTSNLYVMGGLTGLAELRKRMIGGQAFKRVYLQAKEGGFVEENTETLEQSQYIQEFEDTISNALEKAKPEGRANIEASAMQQNWEGLFASIIETNYPRICKRFGNNWQEYQKYMDALVLNELGQAHTRRHSRYGDSDLGPLASIIDEEYTEEGAEALAMCQLEKGKDVQDYVTEIIAESTAIYDEAISVDQLLVLLKEMEGRKLTPEKALEQLYGQTTVENAEEAKPIYINNRLPKLAI